jgi:hypothetical protein
MTLLFLAPFPSEVRAIDEYGKTIRFHKRRPEEIVSSKKEILLKPLALFNLLFGTQNQVLDQVPPLRTLQRFVREGRLKKELDAIHPLTYLLLRWIMNCSGAHIYTKSYSETEGLNGAISDEGRRPFGESGPGSNTSATKLQFFGIHCTPPNKAST